MRTRSEAVARSSDTRAMPAPICQLWPVSVAVRVTFLAAVRTAPESMEAVVASSGQKAS